MMLIELMGQLFSQPNNRKATCDKHPPGNIQGFTFAFDARDLITETDLSPADGFILRTSTSLEGDET